MTPLKTDDQLPDEQSLQWIDEYCSGLIDDESLRNLEAKLLEDSHLRRVFVAYVNLHTDLQFTVMADQAAKSALDRVTDDDGLMEDRPRSIPFRLEQRSSIGRPKVYGRAFVSGWSSVAAGLLFAVVGYFLGHQRTPQDDSASLKTAVEVERSNPNVAWLVNAQDCQWAGGLLEKPGRDMSRGKILQLIRGLAEIEFEGGARLILQGPASLELISGSETKLLRGSLTARVPERARGFTVYSPQGKVIDLGTEFGLSVDGSGETAIRVFEGKVIASPNKEPMEAASNLTLLQDESATIHGRIIALNAAGKEVSERPFVRAIVPPPIVTQRTLNLDFQRSVDGTLKDANGAGIGLTRRLPGTGAKLKGLDTNLHLDTARGLLELTTTRSDINKQINMDQGEYIGVQLADYGFTGSEDFSISATIPDVPALANVGQFGLFVGTRSDLNIRGGLISHPEPDRFGLFLVNNNGGVDSNIYELGITNTGDHLRLSLRRVRGLYSLVVENVTKRNSSTLAIVHPSFLDGERDLQIGLFAACPRSDERKTLAIKDVDVKVWTIATDEPPKDILP